MKKQRIILLTLLLGIFQFAYQAPIEKKANTEPGLSDSISLDGWWKFKQGEYTAGDQIADSVKLPGTMDTNHKGDPVEISRKEEIAHAGEQLEKAPAFTNRLSRLHTYEGKAVYEKEVVVPESWSGKYVELILERTKETRVWINGNYAGWRNSLGVPHLYNVSGLIVPGKENTIAVEVDNESYSAGKEMLVGSHMLTEETTGNWNGIVGRMELQAKDMVHIKSVKVIPNVAGKTARIKLAISSPVQADGTVTFKAESYNGKTSHKVKKTKTNFNTTGGEVLVEYDYKMGNDVRLWSEFNPELYRLDVYLTANNRQFSDKKTISFGMREFTITPDRKQFAINGVTTFLRGEANNNVFPLTGYTPMDKESWLEFLKKFKELGLNHMRFHSWTPPEAAFEAADELGFYMQPELYFFGGRRGPDLFASYSRYAYSKEEGTRILKTLANHPSFVLFSYGNEALTDDPKKIDLTNHFKLIDPTRFYTENTNSIFWDMKRGDNFTGDFRVAMGTQRGWCRIQFYYENHRPSAVRSYDDEIADIKAPFIAHETGQYMVFPDYSEIEKYRTRNSVFKATNLEYFREGLIKNKMLGQNRDFQQATGKWAIIADREEIEGHLRTGKMAGYQFLCFQDFPGQGTALVGIYDSFMNGKGIVDPKDIRKFNSEIVLLALIPKYVWTSDEDFHTEIKVANYSPAPIKDAVLNWQLKGEGGEVVGSGKLDKTTIEKGNLNTVGNISQSLGHITSSQKLTLEMTIEGTEYATDYNIWVYPEDIDVTVPPGIHIARHYDEEASKILRSGGKVLLLPDPDNLNKTRSISGRFLPDFWSKVFHNYSTNDAYTMGLLINNRHPALKGFPTEFHSNWHWYDLVKASRSVILDGTSESYKPIVQTIDHFDRNHKLGNIFETKVGKGKLLVCTFDLPVLLETRPEARQLYRSLLNYMDSDDFNPRETLSVSFLNGLIKED